MKKRTRGNPLPLIVESHPANYNGYPFITLVKYRDDHLLTIVDNADDKNIHAFVLDWCGPEGVNEKFIVDIAAMWWEHRRERFPISFEFSRLGVSAESSKIYKTFNVEFVKRVIGPLPRFDMTEVVSVKRRKRKAIPEGMEVHKKVHILPV
jgi:hypothetical protein